MRAVLVCFALALAACGGDNEDEAGSEGNPYPRTGPNGEIMGDLNFARLMQRFSQGQSNRPGWAGYWWPYTSNGIAGSAARYEAARGRAGATGWESSNHGPSLRGIQDWWGHCNGWAAAAVLFPEPREPETVNGVSFSVGDQKALLSEAGMEVTADFFGHRVDQNDFSSDAFGDVYPNQFFAVLTNIVGNGLPMIIDRYTGDQVWNQPLAGYRIAPVTQADYLGQSPNSNQIHRVMVTMQIWWARNDVPEDYLSQPFDFTDNDSYESRVLRGELWLDGPIVFDGSGGIERSGNLILARNGDYTVGGIWRNGNLETANSHPDYIWLPHSVAPSSGFTNPFVDLDWVIQNFGR